jgi:hypothetical protein
MGRENLARVGPFQDAGPAGEQGVGHKAANNDGYGSRREETQDEQGNAHQAEAPDDERPPAPGLDQFQGRDAAGKKHDVN